MRCVRLQTRETALQPTEQRAPHTAAIAASDSPESGSVGARKPIRCGGHPSWQALPFEADESGGVSRGFVLTRAGKAYGGTLTCCVHNRLARLEVKVGHANPVSEQQLNILLRIQERSKLSRARWDREDGMVTVQATTILFHSDEIEFVIGELADDIRQALEDDRWPGVFAEPR